MKDLFRNPFNVLYIILVIAYVLLIGTAIVFIVMDSNKFPVIAVKNSVECFKQNK